jgi:hypothetical protein
LSNVRILLSPVEGRPIGGITVSVAQTSSLRASIISRQDRCSYTALNARRVGCEAAPLPQLGLGPRKQEAASPRHGRRGDTSEPRSIALALRTFLKRRDAP